MTTRGMIRQKVVALLRERGDASKIADTDSLIMTGRLESMAITELILFLEASFGLDVECSGYDHKDLDSIDNLVSIVSRQSMPFLVC
jgi:acyl carrier protein